MAKRKLNIEDKKYNYYIKEYFSNSENTNLDIYSTILSNKSLYYITNQNHSKHIEIRKSSMIKILKNAELESKEQILFCYYKDIIPIKLNNNNKFENIIKKENNEHKNEIKGPKKEKLKENEDTILTISNLEENQITKNNNYNENNNFNFNNDILYLNNLDENKKINYDSELELLNNNSSDDNLKQKKYLISIYNNKIKITNDKFKCFYLSLFFCGLLYAIYFLDVLIDKNKTFKCLFNIFCFPMATLLIITGLYGYNLINNKKYHDKICIFLTYLYFITPFISFILSRLSSEERVRKNIIISIFINIIILFFSGACLYILKKLQKKNKRGLLFDK